MYDAELMTPVCLMPQLEPLRVKLDPGSKTTGLAVVNDATGEVIFAAEIMHRGAEIKHALDGRRGVRRGSRIANLCLACEPCNLQIGFPCSKPKGAKKVKGFQTGDIVRAVVTSGTKQGKAIPPSVGNAGAAWPGFGVR